MVNVSLFKAYFSIVFLLCLHHFHPEAKQEPTYQVLPSTRTDYESGGEPQRQRKDIDAADNDRQGFQSVKESENPERFHRGPSKDPKDSTQKEQIKSPEQDVFKGNLKSTPSLAGNRVELKHTTSTLRKQENLIRSEIPEPPVNLTDLEFGLNLTRINISSLTPSFDSSVSFLPTVPAATTARDKTPVSTSSKLAHKKTPKFVPATLGAKPQKGSESKTSLSPPKFAFQNKLKMTSSNGSASTFNNKHTNVDPKNSQKKLVSTPEPKERNQAKLNNAKLHQNYSHATIQEEHSTSPTTLPKERKTVIPLDNITDSLKKSPEKISALNAKSADPESSDCPSCGKNGLTQELVRARRIEMFREELMEKLRISPSTDLESDHGFLSDGPSPQDKPVIPPALLEETMAENTREMARDDFHARVQKVLIFGEEGVRDCPQGVTCFSFPLKDRVKERVAEVKLWLQSPGVPNQPGFHNWTVWALHKGIPMESRPPIFSFMSNGEGWLSWNLTELVFDWLGSKADTGDLAIKCFSCLNGTGLFSTSKDFKPAIEVSYDTQASFPERKKRSTPCDPRLECCKQELEVDFHNISLSDRILNPRSLSIGYCFGSCNNTHQISYNHTLWKHKHGQVSNHELREKLKLCCVPLILKEATMLVMVPNVGVQYVVVPKAIVDTCGCL